MLNIGWLKFLIIISGPRSGPTEPKPFDTLVVFQKYFFRKSHLESKSADDKKNKMQKVRPLCILYLSHLSLTYLASKYNDFGFNDYRNIYR